MDKGLWLGDTRTSYDTVAVSYADKVRDRLAETPEEGAVLARFHRVLRPGGPLLLGFHVGDGSRLKTEGYGGHPMKVYVHRRRHAQLTAWLNDAGFAVESHPTLTSAEGAIGGILLARRGPSAPA